MITLSQYYMGRDKTYSHELTSTLRANAEDLLSRVNELLEEYEYGWPHRILRYNPKTDSIVSSGWRPPAINRTVQGAAKGSKHMTCQAIDVFDPDDRLDNFCKNNFTLLRSVGLWLEIPSATPGWCHLQSVAPASGYRMFKP